MIVATLTIGGCVLNITAPDSAIFGSSEEGIEQQEESTQIQFELFETDKENAPELIKKSCDELTREEYEQVDTICDEAQLK